MLNSCCIPASASVSHYMSRLKQVKSEIMVSWKIVMLLTFILMPLEISLARSTSRTRTTAYNINEDTNFVQSVPSNPAQGTKKGTAIQIKEEWASARGLGGVPDPKAHE